MRKMGVSHKLISSVSSFVKELNYELFQVLKSFLIKVNSGIIRTNRIQLEGLFSYIPPGIFTFPSIAGFDTFDNTLISENSLLGIINFDNQKYLISVTMTEDLKRKIYLLTISGDIGQNFRPQELAETLLKEAISNSGYQGKVLRVIYDRHSDRVTFKILPLPDIDLEQIYLKEKEKLELIDFIDAIKQGKEGLRYLFVGEPGTGKTETIKAIISECTKNNNNLTVIVVDAGCRVSLETVFEYAEIFEPVLLCIDDIDLLVGSRDLHLHPSNLSSSLQALDGFISRKKIFLIATTNDRTLVDKALRRPGRFDLIIEFKALHPDFYPSLILRETGDEKLAQMFKNEEIVKKLFSLKANGAFLVTLSRYLSRERFKETKYQIETIIQTIDHLYNSFKREIKVGESIGF